CGWSKWTPSAIPAIYLSALSNIAAEHPNKPEVLPVIIVPSDNCSALAGCPVRWATSSAGATTARSLRDIPTRVMITSMRDDTVWSAVSIRRSATRALYHRRMLSWFAASAHTASSLIQFLATFTHISVGDLYGEVP